MEGADGSVCRWPERMADKRIQERSANALTKRSAAASKKVPQNELSV
jgi:hypothetical protein